MPSGRAHPRAGDSQSARTQCRSTARRDQHEGLVAGDAPIAVLLRLIIQIELAPLYGEPQIMLERAALRELPVHGGREKADRAPALVLGPIERRIGVR
jgi:hypothetical protein